MVVIVTTGKYTGLVFTSEPMSRDRAEALVARCREREPDAGDRPRVVPAGGERVRCAPPHTSRRESVVAALRPDDDWYERMHQRVHGQPSLAARTEKILRDVALMATSSPLFHYLRDSYAQTDPAFRDRMERLSREP